MKRHVVPILVLGLALTMLVAAASMASAFPNKTSECTGCHSADTAVVINATQTSNNGTTATYSVSVSNAYGDGITSWAAFDGTSNVANGYGAGTFSATVGKTYRIWGVAGSGGIGANSVTVTPVAPPVADTTPPSVSITSPASGATVSGLVGVTANASDAGSGVARVDFAVDGVALTSDATSPYSATWDASAAAPGSHAITATAYDKAGLSTTVSISVSIAAPPVVSKAVASITVQSTTGATLAGAKVVLKNTATGARYVGKTTSTGAATFAELPYGTYSVSISARRHARSSTTLTVDAPTESLSVTLSSR